MIGSTPIHNDDSRTQAHSRSRKRRRRRRRKKPPDAAPSAPFDHWLDWFGRHSVTWLDTLVRCSGIHNFATSITFSPLEKLFLANGLRFICTPPISQFQHFVQSIRDSRDSGWPRFSRTLGQRLLAAQEATHTQPKPLTKFTVKKMHRSAHFADQREDEARSEHNHHQYWLDRYRSHTLSLLHRALNSNMFSKAAIASSTPVNYSRHESAFIRRLMQEPSITIKPADKNLGMVLVDTSWYDSELNTMLRDTVTYRPVRFQQSRRAPRDGSHISVEQLQKTLLDQLTRLADRHHSDLERWNPEQADHVVRYLQRHVTTTNVMLPTIYLLIKVHKPKGLCGRPIVPSTRWATTAASVVADHLLQEIVKRANIQHIVKDTKSFINELEHTSFSDQQRRGVFLTADIASLYTNIDTEMGLRLVEQFLQEQHTPLWLHELIMSLLSFVMNNSYLRFHDVVYHQIDGTAMGTAVAPTYANIVVYMLEKGALQHFSSCIFLYRRYLDDIFAYVTAESADRLQVALNSLHPKLRFDFAVHPTEAAFLDLTIYKGERFQQHGLFDLRVHQKHMNLYLYIPYRSFHPLAMKRSFIQTELTRYIRNSSDREDYVRIKRIFYQRLRDRGYTHSFLQPLFESVQYADRQYFLSPASDLARHPLLPYRPPVSPALIKRMDRIRTQQQLMQMTQLASSDSSHPLVFVVPFSPLSRLLPLRRLLTDGWHLVHEAFGAAVPKPIIAYQSQPSLLKQLVYSRAKKMEERRRAATQPQLPPTRPTVQPTLWQLITRHANM